MLALKLILLTSTYRGIAIANSKSRTTKVDVFVTSVRTVLDSIAEMFMPQAHSDDLGFGGKTREGCAAFLAGLLITSIRTVSLSITAYIRSNHDILQTFQP